MHNVKRSEKWHKSNDKIAEVLRGKCYKLQSRMSSIVSASKETFWICTLIPSRSASRWSSQSNDCEETGHLRSENSYF